MRSTSVESLSDTRATTMPSPAVCCAANGAAACVAERMKKASRKTVGRRWRICTLVNQARTGRAVLGDYSLRILKAGAECDWPQPSYEAGEGKSSGTLRNKED